MRTKIVILIIAVVLGLFAAFAAVNYVESARSAIAAEEQPVEVLVAQQDLPAGLSAEELIDEDYIALAEMPRRYVADGAVSSIAVIEGKLLTAPLTKGEQVTTGRFSLPTEAGLSFAVPEDYVAVSLPNSASRGVAGLIRPGDSVVVYATFEIEDAVTKLILPKARVLAVGVSTTSVLGDSEGEEAGGIAPTSSRAAAKDEVSSTLTLALSPADAEKLVFAQEEGKVWLALLGSGTTEVPGTPGQRYPGVIE
ncbi:MAG: Flp pilus assembly protein CpaB [Coriobacteriia bacterium]|nr:Flp pilus assembly protein CpaB [Coriobacteriia bacterium]